MWYLIMAALENRYIRTQVLVALLLKMGAEARCGSCVQSEGLSGNGFGEERVRLLACPLGCTQGLDYTLR